MLSDYPGNNISPYAGGDRSARVTNQTVRPLREPYFQLKQSARQNLKSTEVSAGILNLFLISSKFLRTQCIEVELISLVQGKEYVSFATRKRPQMLSRPINKRLFTLDESEVPTQWRTWVKDKEKPPSHSVLYTLATTYGATSDLFDRNNKKGPATYFEFFIGHLFSRTFGVNPTKRAVLPLSNRSVKMTMDFLFMIDKEKPKVHLPVKMSSRERVVQAWAHQRLLDAAYGIGCYKGILVVHSETKLDLTRKEVVEICVPDQWLAYQRYLGKMERIYYFDIPSRYSQLTKDFPEIKIKLISDFFNEKDAIVSGQTD